MGKKSSLLSDEERSKSIVADLVSGEITDMFQTRKPLLYVYSPSVHSLMVGWDGHLFFDIATKTKH